MATPPLNFMPKGPGGPASLPKSPIGPAGGPGASPMVSPGGNAGGKAKAIAKIRACTETIKGELMNFDVGSKELTGLLGVVKTLNSLVGHTGQEDLTGAARQQIAAAPKPPLAGSPPPGLSGGPPPMPSGAAGGEAPAEY